jgi:hypothetical protein
MLRRHENEVADEFEIVLGRFPGGLPYPHGSERISNASERLSPARTKTIEAHIRLDEFLDLGVVPNDLKVQRNRRARYCSVTR